MLKFKLFSPYSRTSKTIEFQLRQISYITIKATVEKIWVPDVF
jgi:hypothetical protein